MWFLILILLLIKETCQAWSSYLKHFYFFYLDKSDFESSDDLTFSSLVNHPFLETNFILFLGCAWPKSRLVSERLTIQSVLALIAIDFSKQNMSSLAGHRWGAAWCWLAVNDSCPKALHEFQRYRSQTLSRY